ncbi:MAG: hypothetical protein HY926_05755, partial [Elusimicrobia bacterium]|nr:hypothetical protein [Elusimicrobiota bacterium]
VAGSSGNVSGWTGNWVPGSGISFIVDDSPGTSTMTYPAGGAFSQLATISGTADAPLAGFRPDGAIEVCITTDPATGPFWNDGAGYLFNGAGNPLCRWNPATNDPAYPAEGTDATTWGRPSASAPNVFHWIYDPGAAFTGSGLYFIYTRVTDNVANVEASPPLFQVSMDTRSPAVAIQWPKSVVGSFDGLSNSDIIPEAVLNSTYTYGSVSDVTTPFPSGVSQVWLAISSGYAPNNPSIWWSDADQDFTVSLSTIYWSTMVYVSGGSWRYPPVGSSALGSKLKDGLVYSVYVRAKDKAGNWVNYLGDGVNMLGSVSLSTCTNSFRYDITRPTGTVTTPANSSYVTSVSQFAGSAVDTGTASGIKYVYAAVQHLAGDQTGAGQWYNWGNGFWDIGTPNPTLEPLSAAWTQVSSRSVQGVGSVAWSTPVPAGMIASSNTYRVVVFAKDWAGNFQYAPSAAGAGSTFSYDPAPPVTKVVVPTAYNQNAVLTQVTGTAAADMGLAKVWVRVSYEDSSAYWNNATQLMDGGLNRDAAWFPAVPLQPDWTVWSETTTLAANGNSYRLEARAQSLTGAYDVTTDTVTFLYDTVPPQSWTTYPAPGGAVQTLAAISGTSVDPAGAPGPQTSGVNDVQIAVRKNSSMQWWNSGANAFNSGVPLALNPHLSSPGLTPWWRTGRPDSANNDLTSGTSYYITSMAVDLATNQEDWYSLRGSTFIFDTDKPASWISSASIVGDSTISVLAGIAGTTADQPGFSDGTKVSAQTEKVHVLIQRKSDGDYYDGSGWVNSPAILPWLEASTEAVTSTMGNWTLGPADVTTWPTWAHGETYWIVARSSDLAGNVQTAFSVNTDSKTVTFDLRAPTATLTTPGYVNASAGWLVGTSTDAPAGIQTVGIA